MNDNKRFNHVNQKCAHQMELFITLMDRKLLVSIHKYSFLKQ